MSGINEKEANERLKLLAAENARARSQMEKNIGKILTVGAFLLIGIFLWMLTLSLGSLYIFYFLILLLAGGVALFAWGLKLVFFGTNKRARTRSRFILKDRNQ